MITGLQSRSLTGIDRQCNYTERQVLQDDLTEPTMIIDFGPGMITSGASMTLTIWSTGEAQKNAMMSRVAFKTLAGRMKMSCLERLLAIQVRC